MTMRESYLHHSFPLPLSHSPSPFLSGLEGNFLNSITNTNGHMTSNFIGVCIFSRLKWCVQSKKKSLWKFHSMPWNSHGIGSWRNHSTDAIACKALLLNSYESSKSLEPYENAFFRLADNFRPLFFLPSLIWPDSNNYFLSNTLIKILCKFGAWHRQMENGSKDDSQQQRNNCQWK